MSNITNTTHASLVVICKTMIFCSMTLVQAILHGKRNSDKVSTDLILSLKRYSDGL